MFSKDDPLEQELEGIRKTDLCKLPRDCKRRYISSSGYCNDKTTLYVCEKCGRLFVEITVNYPYIGDTYVYNPIGLEW